MRKEIEELKSDYLRVERMIRENLGISMETLRTKDMEREEMLAKQRMIKFSINGGFTK